MTFSLCKRYVTSPPDYNDVSTSRPLKPLSCAFTRKKKKLFIIQTSPKPRKHLLLLMGTPPDQHRFCSLKKIKVNHLYKCMPDNNVRGADVVVMTQFEEVLDLVRLGLTWASPDEIRALLEGLVEERIVSEAYSKSLSLRRLTEGMAPEPAPAETACQSGSISSPGSDQRPNRGQLCQVWRDSAAGDHVHAGPESVSPVDGQDGAWSGPKTHPPVMDEHYLNHRLLSSQTEHDFQRRLALDEEVTELLRGAESMQKPASDNERINEGNSEDEREWLEQVEEAARKIAVPLWQHWDRGRSMLLPLVPCMTTGCSTSENSATGSDSRCPALNMEEETELAIACRTLDFCANSFYCTEIIDPEFTLDAGGAADTPEGLGLPTSDGVATTGLNTDHFSFSGAARNASPVEACPARDTNYITDGLVGDLDVCWMTDTTEDLLSLTGDTQCGFPGFREGIAHLLSPCMPKDPHTEAQDHSLYSNTNDGVENVFRDAYGAKMCSTDSMTGFSENKEDEERLDSHWGKFALTSCALLSCFPTKKSQNKCQPCIGHVPSMTSHG